MSAHRPRAIASAFALLAFVGPRPVLGAVTIDGVLDPDYGSATVVQTLQTGLSSGGQIPGDNTLGDLNYASGSELDAAYALVTGDTLRLFLTGNLALRLTMQGNETRGHVLDVFVDCAPGGQNQLISISTGNPMNGMTLEAGFEADYWFEFWGEGDQFNTDWWAGQGELETPNGGTFTLLGRGIAGGPGTLTSATNPHGIKVTIDNRNVAGVTFGCNASSGAGATRGIEWEIPLTAIGSPEGCFRLMAIVRDNSTTSPISNSVLAPVPPGTCPMGPVQFVNFTTIAGDQTFEACPSLIDVPPVPAGAPRLRLAFVGANPVTAGDRLAFTYALPDDAPASLELFDVTGRIVRARELAGAQGTVELSAGRALAPGLYWARLSHRGASVVRRICVAG